MKRIEAYIQEFMLQRVLKELRAVHVTGMTVMNVRGFGREKDDAYPHTMEDHAVDFVSKVKIEILCRDDEVTSLLEAIRRGAHTGRAGDGKIFVTPVEQLVAIRDDRVDEGAL
jgi:nitrogen regulatory protein P-II 1